MLVFFFVLQPSIFDARNVEPEPLAEIWGVGEGVLKKFTQMDIHLHVHSSILKKKCW